MSDATRKMVLKQATQRALFTGVTFGIGRSYFWKNIWAQNTFPIIILFFLNTPVKNKKWHFVCLCEPQHGEISFRFQVFIFGRGC